MIFADMVDNIIVPRVVPKWWNWQTRHLEGVVGKPVRVQIPPSAPENDQGARRKLKPLFHFLELMRDLNSKPPPTEQGGKAAMDGRGRRRGRRRSEGMEA